MEQIRVCTYDGPGAQPVIRNVPWPKIPKKAALIKGVTDLLVRVLNKNPATTVVVIDEVELTNWGMSGESVEVLRQRT